MTIQVCNFFPDNLIFEKILLLKSFWGMSSLDAFRKTEKILLKIWSNFWIYEWNSGKLVGGVGKFSKITEMLIWWGNPRQLKNALYIADNKVLITELSFKGTFLIKSP